MGALYMGDIEDVETDELVRELAYRGRETVLEALIAIKTGRVDDGVAVLEREFFPKWADSAECQRQYSMAMGLGEARRAA